MKEKCEQPNWRWDKDVLDAWVWAGDCQNDAYGYFDGFFYCYDHAVELKKIRI